MHKKSFLSWLWYAVRLVAGAGIYAVGFRLFLYPNAIVGGGVSGIAMILNYLSALPVGLLSILLNIPIFIIGWRKFGFRFMLGSLAGMLLSSVLVDLVGLLEVTATQEPLLAAIYGGLLSGLGLGLVFSTGATTGGVDIVAKLLRLRMPHINMGVLILGLDALVVLSFALLFRRYDSAMYAIISMFIMSRAMDLVLYGTVNAKLCYVITENSEGVSRAILENLGRGVTVLRGAGGWSGEEKTVLLCAVGRRQAVQLRQLVQQVDDSAFLIITDAREVFGKGFADFERED